MRDPSKFARGSGVYACRCCGRQTRSTGRGDNENVQLCAECYDLSGYENAISDGQELTANDMAAIKELYKAIAAKGGKVAGCWDDQIVAIATAGEPKP